MDEQDLPNDARNRPLDTARIDEHAYLTGAPPIEEFLGYVRSRAEEGTADLGRLSEAWRAAAQCRRELELTEAGFADNAEIRPLPSELKPLAERELQEPGVRRSLERVPYYWAVVDLDQLVVHQRSLDLSFVRRLSARFPTRPTDEQLFQLAAGYPRPDPAKISVTRSENVTTFVSASSDLRILETTLLDPKSISGYSAPGRASRLVAVAVGYGCNFASAFHIRGRLVLQNALHRESMVYRMGIRRVPCLVREISTEEDLVLVGANDVKQHLSLYVRSPRPPRLSDFLDPRLHVTLRVPFANRLAHVQVNTQLSRARVAVMEGV